ncbi:16S rRNA (guanine(966)-N(2))-methyltransferase RsmD [Meridianimarinicoccus sp. RP-17]|uniref:16S rRNA (guanine(966)-N(2))-methyltransferase RsmD n=1 Tax=Meridianimarinicoccus zhengii TaxID=2056810 RepID=UPI000DAC9BD3|nr:16S rRNA (guanine(966)-N(2))-methyltransferase RsmD [Phycocomes zhengii]
MRIIAGTRKGLQLAALGKGDPAAHLRPTPDRVRESLFSALASRPDDPVTGAHVLDLFAGTGALGLEALSRGAAHATFVENGRAALRLLTDNIARADATAAARIVTRDAARLPPCGGPPASLVFLDPPYGKNLGARALAAARAGGWIAPGALVVWEEASPQDAPAGFAPDSLRRYGTTHVTLLTAAADPEL